MKRRNIILIIGFLLAIAAVALLPGLADSTNTIDSNSSQAPGRTTERMRSDRKNNEIQQEVPVRSQPAIRENIQEYLSLNGEVDFSSTVEIYPDTSGKIAGYTVSIGDTVQKGALLVHVDPSRPGERFEISPVYAPTSGTIISAPYSTGTTVGTTTAILKIARTDDLEIHTHVIERNIGYLKTGLTASVRLEAWPEETFNATVSRVNPFLDPESRTKKVTLLFDKQDSIINAGMFASVRLETRLHENVITVPDLSIIKLIGDQFVWIIDGDNRARRADITSGISVDGRTIILSGLSAGERVIVEGIQALAEGRPVRDIGQDSIEGTNP